MKCFRKVILESDDCFAIWEFKMGTLAPTQHARAIVVMPHQGQQYLLPFDLFASYVEHGCGERALPELWKSRGSIWGCVVSGLNCNSYLFAASPPYFDFTGVENKSNSEQNLDTIDKKYIPRGDRLKSRIFCIFQYGFASLYYHFDFLRQKLHKKDKLHSSLTFTQVTSEVQGLAKVRFPWNTAEDAPAFTVKLNFGFTLLFSITY